MVEARRARDPPARPAGGRRRRPRPHAAPAEAARPPRGLALRAGRHVSKDLLVELIWGQDSPRRAIDALENYVSQLRKLLGRDAIGTRPGGYQLQVSPEEVDVTRFERLIAEARAAEPRERAEGIRAALTLFRGPPLADLAYEPFAPTEIGRLEELELTAREDLVDAELEVGRHADVVPDLEVLIAGHPYRERPRAQLMLALYRAGRQAEALEVFHEARRLLVDELGLEPGAELQELERAILRQDEALRPPARVERAAPAQRLPPPASRRALRKTVAILVSELAGAAALAERLDPELLRVVLDGYLAAARGAVTRHGGIVGEQAGDTVAAVFGIPAAHEDDVLRAVRAAVGAREAVAALNDELLAGQGVYLEPRTGVAAGEVLVGGEALPTGRAVGRARELARAARAGQILLDEGLRGAVRRWQRSSRRRRRPRCASSSCSRERTVARCGSTRPWSGAPARCPRCMPRSTRRWRSGRAGWSRSSALPASASPGSCRSWSRTSRRVRPSSARAVFRTARASRFFRSTRCLRPRPRTSTGRPRRPSCSKARARFSRGSPARARSCSSWTTSTGRSRRSSTSSRTS